MTEPRVQGRRGAVIACYVIAMCMNGLDSTIVNPALVTIARDFGRPVEAAATVETAFLVAMAVALPIAGWTGDRFGAARTFGVGVAVFTAASACCAVAPSLGALTVGRAVQGAAGGLLTPAGMTLLFLTFAPEERARLSRYIIVPTALMPALGPLLGGFLTEHGDWRMLFLLNVPLGLAVVVTLIVAVRDGEPTTTGRLDVIGFVLASLATGLLVLATGLAPTRGWGDALVLSGLAVGVLAGVALLAHQRRAVAPLLDLQLYRDRGYAGASVLAALSAAGLMGVLFVIPLVVQITRGQGPLAAGLSVFPEALGLMAASVVVERLLPRLGPRALALGAFALATLAFGLLALPVVVDAPWGAPVALFVIGLVLGAAVLTVQLAGFDTIRPDDMSQAMGLFQIVRTLGGAFGIALVAGIASVLSFSAALVVTACLIACCMPATRSLPRTAMPPGPPPADVPPDDSTRPDITRPDELIADAVVGRRTGATASREGERA